MPSPKLIIIRGPSGAGKSTIARAVVDASSRPTALVQRDHYMLMFNDAGRFSIDQELIELVILTCLEHAGRGTHRCGAVLVVVDVGGVQSARGLRPLGVPLGRALPELAVRISLRTARDQVRVARRLEELPLVRAAFADGVLSYSKARAITRVAAPETEAQLVEWAQHATAAQLDRLVAGRRSVDRPEREARYATWGWEDDGSFVLRARLSPEEGALVLAALQSARAALEVGVDTSKSGSAEPLSSDEPEPLRPTAADAVVAMAETTLAHGPTPVSAGDRHMMLVHVKAETGGATLENGVALSEAAAQQVLCDSSFATIRFGHEGEPLHMGRKTRDPTPAQRRALLVRDGGCRFPGCEQRSWVDAHHVHWWEFGGRTDIDNLVLLCRVHHRAIHHRGYRVEPGPRQSFRFYNPAGIRLMAAPTLTPPTGQLDTVGANGNRLTPDTPVPHWDGSHPNYA